MNMIHNMNSCGAHCTFVRVRGKAKADAQEKNAKEQAAKAGGTSTIGVGPRQAACRPLSIRVPISPALRAVRRAGAALRAAEPDGGC